LFGRAVADPDTEPTEARGEKPGWWRRWIVRPLARQLKQGTSPDKLGWTIGAGITLGIFPIFGTRAWLCLLAGVLFKLNQPLLHTFKGLMYPLHLALIIPFIRLGERLYGKAPLQLSLDTLKDGIANGAWTFWQEFGWIILQAASAWLLVAPVLLLILKWLVTPGLERLGRRLQPAD
jgi:hypothetical protein